jgi:hypothetical protein
MIIERKNMKNMNGISLFPFIFVVDKTNKRLVNHELIHYQQQKEMLIIPFYILYFIEWLFRGANHSAYLNISFEREAYENDDNLDYLKNRKLFSWVKYMKKIHK